MKNLIACCGIDCEKCDAYVATIKNSDELRKETAAKWQKMFNAPSITPESINCSGCRVEGVKFTHCLMCEIRKCVNAKGYETCGECADMASCKTVAMVHQYMPECISNLRLMN